MPTFPSTFPRGWPLLAVGLGCLGLPMAWRIWVASSSSSPGRPLPVHDDLVLALEDLDAGPREESAHDVLVAGESELYLALGDARTIRSFPKGGGPGRDIAKLDQAAAGMVLAAGSLWVAAGQDVERIAPLPDGKMVAVTTGLHRAIAIASDGVSVFVVDEAPAESGLLPESKVLRLPPDGGKPVVLGRGEGAIDTLVLLGDSLFWCDRLDGTILAVPKVGGAPRVLASERGLPEKLTAHDGALYWVERRSESLWTMPASGGTPRRITQDFAGFANLLADRRGVFWSNEAAVDGAFRVLLAPAPRSGDELTASNAVREIDALATDGVNLYWDREGSVERVPAPGD